MQPQQTHRIRDNKYFVKKELSVLKLLCKQYIRRLWIFIGVGGITKELVYTNETERIILVVIILLIAQARVQDKLILS